ncbi:MAG: glycosyltransferase, partial [Patescibacteria group bacterium]
MKIGIDIRTLMDAQYSGVSEYTLNLIQNILKLDSKNDYRLFYNSARDIGNRMPEFDYPNAEVVKFNYPNKILNYIGFKLLDLPKIDKLLDVDIFFMPHMNFIAFSGKAKSILTIHDLSFLRYGGFFSLRKNFWHRMLNVGKMVKQADRIVAISESTKNDIIELCGAAPDKIKVIHSGVGKEFRVIDKDDDRMPEIKDKYGLPD